MKFFLLFVLSSYATLALACSCKEPGPVADELKRSDAVFDGKVLKIETVDGTQVVIFEVQAAWKGAEAKQYALSVSPNKFQCDYTFKKGKRYLVYANKRDPKESEVSVSICSRTKPFEKAQTDLKDLGPAQ